MTATTSEPGAVVDEGRPRRGRGLLSWLGQVLSWFVMLSIGAALLVSFVIPRLAGATTYVVETGSMRPDLPPGTIVVSKPVDPSAVATGDVVTYQLRSGDPTVVTHRVVSIGYDGAGEVRWQTKGDANDAIDEQWVVPAQLKGGLWYSVPFLGRVTALAGGQRGLMVGLIALGLGGYAVAQFRGALHDRRSKRQPIDVPA